MAKPFRKLEVMFNGSIYVIDWEGAEQLLAALNRQAGVCTDVLLKVREDLRAALSTTAEEPEAANPFADESEETPAPWHANKLIVNVAKENAEECGDCRIPKCRFCEKPGTRAGGRKDGAGRTVEKYYVCKTDGCIAAKMATPQPMALFAGGAA